MEVLKRLDNAVLVIKFISDDIDSTGQFISQNCNFVVKCDKSNSFQGVVLLDFLKLGLNCTQYALLSGDESFVLILISREPI